MSGTDEALTDAQALADRWRAEGVAGVTIAWADANGIPRSRTVPIAALSEVARTGVGASTVLAAFDTNDVIRYGTAGLETPSGDTRVHPVLDHAVHLAGQPALAWAPSRIVTADGDPWPLDTRSVLERTVETLGRAGYEALVGYEMEFGVYTGDSDTTLTPAHPGPAYSPHTLLAIDAFVAQLLRDAEANGLRLGQLHAEYGPAQVELSLAATDPLAAADQQLLARETIRAAAAAHGLRVSLAPLPTQHGAGNGWHVHTSLWRGGRNVLADDAGRDGYVAGLLRDLPALAAVTAPSIGSLARLRPGFFAGAFGFWGVQNREAPLRFVPGTRVLGDDAANLELKTSDASANPYLALAALLSVGAAGVEEGLTPPAPIAEDPGTWSDERRAAAGVVPLPGTQAEQEQVLRACPRITDVLGADLTEAFLAIRRADAAFAADRDVEDVLAGWRWKY